jgi:hypothetical protein
VRTRRAAGRLGGPTSMNRPTQHEQRMAGRLEGVELPVLLRDLNRRRATGRLHVERRGEERSVLLVEGRVTFTASSNPNDRLGEHLLRAGKITVSQLEATLAESGTGKRLGTLMVEAGIFSSEELVKAVVGQIRTVMLDLLTWTEGDYRFEEGPATEEDITLDISTEELLFRGVRQIRSSRLIERGLGSPRTVLRLCDDWRRRIEALKLTEGARAIADRLAEGPASVDTLCREVSVSNFVIQQTLWAFMLLGVAEACGRRRNDESEGSLQDVGLAELLIRHETNGDTGVLYVSRGSVERGLLFAAGHCVFATSSDPDDGLVNFLYRRGVISLRDREETVRRLLSNKRVGTILRELGAIDDADLQSMVRQQVSEIIWDTFGWESGEFVFVPSSLPSAEEITLSCGVRALIAEGVRRVTSWTRLVQSCGGMDNPLCLTPTYLEILDDIDASVAEWEVINTLKVPQTPRRVCALCELPDFRVCQILWTLKVLGAVEDSPIEVFESDPDEAQEMAGHGPLPVEDAPAEEAVEFEARTADVDVAPSATDTAEELEDDRPAPPDARETALAERDEAFSSEQEELSPYPHKVQREQVEQALLSPGDQAEPTPVPSADERPPSATDADQGAPVDATVDDDEVLEPEYEVPPGVEQVILRFNAMHRIVYRAVRSEIGAGAVNFVRSCRLEACQELADPLEDVELHADGSWDVRGLKRVIVEQGIEDAWPAYQRVLEQEFVSLQPHLGATRADQLKQEIWEVEQISG